MMPHLPGRDGVLLTYGCVAVALLGVFGVLGVVGHAVRALSRRAPAIRVAALAASACTAYSADTSWRFAADYLAMGSTAERAAMFAAAELGLLATALLARQNLNGPSCAPGVPGVLVWVITGVQVIPAYAESGPVGGTVRAFVGPIMAALLWHLAMGIELRHRRPGAANNGFAALIAREARERTLSRLGLAVRDRDAAQITRDRATHRAVALAARLADLDPRRRDGRRARRTARKLSVAVARSAVGSDADQRRKLLELLAARRNAAALATVDLPSPWADAEALSEPAARALAGLARQDIARAAAAIRSWPLRPFIEHLQPSTGHAPKNSREQADPAHDATRSPERPPHKLDTRAALAAIEAGWADGLSVRETARRATRAPSYVHSVFTRLDGERGPRPPNGQVDSPAGTTAVHPDDQNPERPADPAPAAAPDPESESDPESDPEPEATGGTPHV